VAAIVATTTVAIVGLFAVAEAALRVIAHGHMEAALVAMTMEVCAGISAVARALRHLQLLDHLQLQLLRRLALWSIVLTLPKTSRRRLRALLGQ
jgi:hypothetical protein